MALNSRPYTDHDLPHLQAALATWIHKAGACGYCHVGDVPHRIYSELRGSRPVGELVQVWVHGAAIVGMAINLRFGSVFDVFCSPQLRGTDHEAEMLRSAYETTLRFARKAANGIVSVITDVFSCDVARDEILTRLGFERYRLFDYITERSLSQPISEPWLPSGFTIRSATMDDYQQLAAVRNSSFGEDWSADSLRAEVMQKPGYRPEREFIVVSPEGRVAAFTVTWLDEVNRVGHFEPVGTHRGFRRRGLARAMMLHALRELRALGMETATVEHAADNTPALELYRGLGFEKRYETYGYRRIHRNRLNGSERVEGP